MAEEKLNIYQKLAKVRRVVEVVQKNKSGYGYKYVSDDELLAKITGTMDKYGLSLVPAIVSDSFNVTPYTYVKSKKGIDETVNEILVNADMVFRWVNNDDPDEFINIPWALVGQQADASQAFGSGLTYSYRYFLLKYFGVATPEDDPDNWRSKQKAAESEEDKAIAAQIIGNFDMKVRDYLASHKDKSAEVKELVTKYVKSGDYFKITESALAMKLESDFMSKFGEKNENV